MVDVLLGLFVIVGSLVFIGMLIGTIIMQEFTSSWRGLLYLFIALIVSFLWVKYANNIPNEYEKRTYNIISVDSVDDIKMNIAVIDGQKIVNINQIFGCIPNDNQVLEVSTVTNIWRGGIYFSLYKKPVYKLVEKDESNEKNKNAYKAKE